MVTRIDLDNAIDYLYSISDSQYAKIVVQKSYSGEYDYENDIDCVLKLSRQEVIDILETNNNISLDIEFDKINEENIIISIYENW